MSIFGVTISLPVAIAFIAICCMIFDFLSGVAKATFNQELSSSKMREGLGHKAAVLFYILAGLGVCGAAHVLAAYPEVSGIAALSGIGFIGDGLAYATFASVIIMEVRSVYENLNAMNSDLAIPDIIKNED